MAGRYGADQLSRLFLFISLLLMIISMFIRIPIFYFAAILILVYTYFRIFSRNIQKRYEENQRYLNWKYRLVVKKDRKKQQFAQRNIYRFYKCPSCKQKVRVPRGKGKICITCPKCRTEFVKKS